MNAVDDLDSDSSVDENELSIYDDTISAMSSRQRTLVRKNTQILFMASQLFTSTS